MSSFSEGFAPRANTLQSGGMEKMPLKKMAKEFQSFTQLVIKSGLPFHRGGETLKK